MKTSQADALNTHIGAAVTSSKHAVLTARHIAELPWKGTLGSRRGIHEVDGDGQRLAEPGHRFARHPTTSPRPVFPFPLDSRVQTQGAVTSWQALLSSGNEAAADTQLGVSTTHVVVTTRTHIGFYNKAGQLQQPEIYVNDFFAPLGLDQVLGPGLTYFDTRSMFDQYRKRFWVGVLAIKQFPDKNGVPANNLTKFAVAVSSTENPQDPWFLYWWDAVAHDGDPSSGVFEPGDWGDYPTLGIDAKCVYQTNPVSNSGSNRYCHVQIFPAWQMAAGDPGPINGWQFWDLSEPNGTKATRLTPAVHHGNNSRGFFVGPNLGSSMLVWGIQDPLGPNQRMDRAALPIASFAGPKDAPQENSSQLIRTTNIATDPLRASCRNNVLSFSFNDGTDWGQPGGVISSNRLIRVDLSAFPALPQAGDAGYRDRIFGFNNPIEDQPGDRFAYAWPAVDTNALGDMVVVYNRTGVTRDPEIRFSTWMNSEPDIRPSRLLKAGEKPYALSWVAQNISLPWADTAGVSVDPYDDVAVWFAHTYADSHTTDGNYAVWVGKVFGSRFPWVKVRLNLVAGPRHPRPGEPVEFEVQFENGGDGESPATRAHVLLVSESSDKDRLLSLRVPEIRAAGSVTLRITTILPEALPSGAYQIEVTFDPGRRFRQYSHAASTARLPLKIKS